MATYISGSTYSVTPLQMDFFHSLLRELLIIDAAPAVQVIIDGKRRWQCKECGEIFNDKWDSAECHPTDDAA